MQRRSLAALTVAALVWTGAWAGVWTSAAGAGADFLGSYQWPPGDPHHGGWSAIEMSPDGRGFSALSDRGFWITGSIDRDPEGRIRSVSDGPVLALRGLDGAQIPARIADSEGLAQGADGQLYVSFEGVHRVWRYPGVGGRPQALPRPRSFSGFQTNSGLEALAVDASGALYTLPERSGMITTPFPVWRFADGRWQQPFSLPRRGDHLPVGADFGPDGRLYLLERHFAGLLGFSARIRRFTLGPDGIVDEDTLLTTPVGRHGNLEGLSVWADASGAIRLTLVADNNFRAFQRSEIVEYRVAP